jgi:hypothetical protein
MTDMVVFNGMRIQQTKQKHIIHSTQQLEAGITGIEEEQAVLEEEGDSLQA